MTATMDHALIQQFAAGAALDDLDRAERGELDRHLAGCMTCARLAVDLESVVADLALAVPDVRPPSSLRSSVLSALREPGPSTPAFIDDKSGPLRRTARPPRLAMAGSLGLAAAFGVVALGLGARSVQLTDQIEAVRSADVAAAEVAHAKVATREAALALLGDPAHLAANLHAEGAVPAASAFVVYLPGSTDAYVMAMNLPPTPAGQVYQLWVADAAGVHPLGTFQFDGQGAFVAPFGVDLAGSSAAMITLEAEGGAHGEPGPQVVFGEV